MGKITAHLTKELRKRTGAGIMDCKKSLIEANGDIELAIINLRKLGILKYNSVKKTSNETAEGLITTKIRNNRGTIIEVNCQTDFVARCKEFQSFAANVINMAAFANISNIDLLREHFKEEIFELSSKVNEEISIRRLSVLKGLIISSYQHKHRIGVIIATKNTSKELSKHLAMHITACKPEFIKPEDIPSEIIKKEYNIQLDIALRLGKPKEIAEKIAKGRIKKFIEEVSLLRQQFVMDPSKNINQLLEIYNAEVTGFIRFELGEDNRKININDNLLCNNLN